MREILFRGKVTPEYCEDHALLAPGDWVSGGINICDGVPYIICDNGAEAVPVIPETVGQFTGLTDKDGTRIFEGDIALCYFWDGVISKAVIKFGMHQNSYREDNRNYGWYLEWIDDDSLADTKPNIAGWQWFSVIGNIYDNSDL